MPRARLSIRKEDRIWALRCQGYRLEEIARIVDCSTSAVHHAVKRVRQRPPLHLSPIRRGRHCGFLDTDQVRGIRHRRSCGETLHAIARDYDVTPNAISLIARGISYPDRRGVEQGYPWRFGNRLVA